MVYWPPVGVFLDLQNRKDLEMRTYARLASYAVVCVAMVFSWGCEEGQSSDPDIGNVKKHRLIAAENRSLQGDIEDLKGEIAKRDAGMVALKDDHAKAIEAEKAAQAKVAADRDRWQAKATEGVKEEVSAVLLGVMALNEQLRAENEALKAEIAASKAPEPTGETQAEPKSTESAGDEGQ